MNPRFKKFLSFYKPYRRLFLADMACAMLASLMALLLPLVTRHITRNILGSPAPTLLRDLYTMGALMVALVAVYTLCNLFVDYRGHLMGALIERDMRQALYDHYQTLSFRFYDEQRTGQLMSRLTNDLFWLSEFCHHGPEDLIIGLFTLLGVTAISLTINGELTLLILLFLPAMTLYALYFSRRMNRALRQSKERIGDINAHVEDSLSGIRVVKSFANEAIEKRRFAAGNDRFLDSRRDGYRSEAAFSGGMIAFTHLLTIAVVIFGGARLAGGSLDLPDLLAYLLYVGILVEPVHRLVNFARLYQEGITGFDRFMDILDIEPDIRDAPGAIELARVEGAVDFRNVSFSYRNGDDHLLKNLDLTIAAGEYVALVGFSGVGKTTLCSLVPRFYDVTGGELLLDGHDVRTVSLRSLRRNIGLVDQDVYLFAGTVAGNIRYGRPDATPEEIVEAARRANAHDFIVRLPDGYETDIGQRGVKLSGGQKQRLSIARAFLKDPPVLILDEATSSLDNESERAIQASLDDLARNRTTIVIAHRLSTVRNARRIVVLTETGISEEGTHDELIARGGVYASFYALQLEIGS